MRCVTILCMVAISAAGADWARLMDQADAQEHAGSYKEAAAGYEAARRLAEKFDSNDPRLPITWNKLGMTYDAMGRFSDADRWYRRALTWVERVQGKTNGEYSALLNNLAGLYLEQGRFTEAEPLIRQAVATGTGVLPANDLRLAMARSGLADLLIKRGRYRESEQLLNQAIQVFEERPGSGVDLGIALNNLAVVRRGQKRNEDSRRLLESALTAIEADAGPEHPALARILNNLGTAYAALGRPQEADQAFRRSVAIAADRLGTEHPLYGVMLYNYARFLRDGGRKAEARTLEAQSRAVIEDSAQRNGAGMTMDVSAFRRK